MNRDQAHQTLRHCVEDLVKATSFSSYDGGDTTTTNGEDNTTSTATRESPPLSLHEKMETCVCKTAHDVEHVEKGLWEVANEDHYHNKDDNGGDNNDDCNNITTKRVLSIAYKSLLERVLNCAAKFSWRWEHQSDLVEKVQYLFLNKLCHPLVMTTVLHDALRQSQNNQDVRSGVVRVITWILPSCLEDTTVRKQYLEAIITKRDVALLPCLVTTSDGASMLNGIATYVVNSLGHKTPWCLVPSSVNEAIAAAIPECVDERLTESEHHGDTTANAILFLCHNGETKVLAKQWLRARTSQTVPLLRAAAQGFITGHNPNDKEGLAVAAGNSISLQASVFGPYDLCQLFVLHAQKGLTFLSLVPESYREKLLVHIIKSGREVLTDFMTEMITVQDSNASSSFLNQFRNPLFISFGSPLIIFSSCNYSIRSDNGEPLKGDADIPDKSNFDIGGNLTVAASVVFEHFSRSIPIGHALTPTQTRILCSYLSVSCREHWNPIFFCKIEGESTVKEVILTSEVKEGCTFPLSLWLKVWADPSFVSTSDRSFQASLTRLILYAMRILPSKLFGTASIYSPSVMEGVQARMSCNNARIQRLGLRVAQQFSERTALQLRKERHLRGKDEATEDDLEPLQFDEEDLESDSDWSVDSDFTNDWCMVMSERIADKHPKANDTETQVAEMSQLIVDDSESNSEDELQPYEIPEHETEKIVSASNVQADEHDAETSPSRPFYLHDALAGVKDQNNYKKVEICIRTLPSLIKELAKSTYSSNELHNNVGYLLRTLLAVDNYFGLEDFEYCRSQSLHAACVKSPVLSVRFLSKVVFAQEQTVGTRLTVLDYLSEAVMELAGIAANKEDNTQTRRKLSAKTDHNHGDSQMITKKDGTVRPRTRRWSSRRNSPSRTYKTNTFAEIAGEYFFPFIARLRDPSSGVDPFGYDSLFLGHLIRYLAIVVESAYLSPKIQRMAKELFSLVWLVRFHDAVAVRKAVLLALFAVIKTVSNMKMVDQESEIHKSTSSTVKGVQSDAGSFGLRKMIQELDENGNPLESNASANSTLSETSTSQVERAAGMLTKSFSANTSKTFGGDIVESLNWLHSTYEHDPDDQCRALAAKIMQYGPLQEIIEEATVYNVY